MSEHFKHDDCRNFAPIDVAKGYCHCHKQLVAIDTQVCDKFDPLPKCRNCANFIPDQHESEMGTCNIGKGKPWTYPDLIAVTCEQYKNQ